MGFDKMSKGDKITLLILLCISILAFFICLNDYDAEENDYNECAAIACDKEAGLSGYCDYHSHGKYVQDKNKHSYTYTPETTRAPETNVPETQPQNNDVYYDNDWLFGEDYFDVDMYGNPEDFYDDYYDDFWDYEEAEEYYYSHGGQ